MTWKIFSVVISSKTTFPFPDSENFEEWKCYLKELFFWFFILPQSWLLWYGIVKYFFIFFQEPFHSRGLMMLWTPAVTKRPSIGTRNILEVWKSGLCDVGGKVFTNVIAEYSYASHGIYIHKKSIISHVIKPSLVSSKQLIGMDIFQSRMIWI